MLANYWMYTLLHQLWRCTTEQSQCKKDRWVKAFSMSLLNVLRERAVAITSTIDVSLYQQLAAKILPKRSLVSGVSLKRHNLTNHACNRDDIYWVNRCFWTIKLYILTFQIFRHLPTAAKIIRLKGCSMIGYGTVWVTGWETNRDRVNSLCEVWT